MLLPLLLKPLRLALILTCPSILEQAKKSRLKICAFLIEDLTGYQGEVVFTGEVSDGQPKRMLDVQPRSENVGLDR